jgi:glutamate synthase (NADPH/NADH) small chain
MLGFVKSLQKKPKKRSNSKRKADFMEIYQPWPVEQLSEQAERCSQCGVPFCQTGCPLSNNIPDWLRLAAEGRIEEAYLLSATTNSMPEICGRICPQDKLCEGSCVIEKDFGSVTIGAVEKSLTDEAYSQGWVKPINIGKKRVDSIGIIGAGPAGLSAAEQLRRYGYEVHIYDRYDRAGGMLIYGIPEFKLEKDIVKRRVDRLIEGGVKFHLDFEVGVDASLKELRQKHKAVLIATGTYKARQLSEKGADKNGIIAAMDYLTAANKTVLGDKVEAFLDGTLDAKDKNIIVIGGGDTAMDCVRTAIRQKAKSVRCLYRRDLDNMPGSRTEVNNAIEEGVDFIWLSTPVSFDGGVEVTTTIAQKMQLGSGDENGRQIPSAIENSNFNLDTDMVITALGFEAEDLPDLFSEPDLKTSPWGTIELTDNTSATNLDGVFAAGDISRGPSLVVWAIKDGRDAARDMHKYLSKVDDDPIDELGADYFAPIKHGLINS